MKYFISGHREVTEEEFEKFYVPAIEKVLEEDSDVTFVVGDYQGVDTMAQEWLGRKVPDRVTVYHMFTKPRILVSDLFKTIGGFRTDEERDAAMTRDSDRDIAFLKPGKRNSGTAQNICRRLELIQ